MNQTTFDAMSPRTHSPQALIDAFHQLHGADGIVIGNSIVYSDGAERDMQPMGCLQPPPDDPEERAQVIVTYWETLEERTRDKFENLKAEIADYSRGALSEELSPAPFDETEKAIAQLEALQKEVRSIAAKSKQARRDLAASRPFARGAEAKRIIKARSDAHRQANREILTAIEKIRI